MSSRDPNHVSLFFITMLCGSSLKMKYYSFSLFKPYHSIMGKNLDCYNKVSLKFHPYPCGCEAGCLRHRYTLACHMPFSHSSQWCCTHFCWFSKSVLVTKSRLFEHIKTFRGVLHDSLPYLNFFFHLSCDRYCTLQLVDQKYLFKDWGRHKMWEVPSVQPFVSSFLSQPIQGAVTQIP